MSDPVADLVSYLDRSPTPYHAVMEAVRRLENAGFIECSETDVWDLSSGDCRYVVRGDSGLIAFQVGSRSPVDAGFRIIGSHTDSPNLRLKPCADVTAHGYSQVGVETYGAVLLHTWLDRDLSLAGRISIRTSGEPRQVLIDFARSVCRIPSLAIHLDREVNKEGLKLNAQTHLLPIAGLDEAVDFRRLLVRELDAQSVAKIEPEDILAFDLMLYDVQPANVGGAYGEFIQSGRIDNLMSCHAALCALVAAVDATPSDFTRLIVLYDHEEVGSRSTQGAAGNFLVDVLARAVVAFDAGEPQGYSRAAARSMLISADMAHAVHPNYADRHDPGHRPVVGRGPVIKAHAGQAYATDATTAGLLASLCARIGVEPQHFVSRSDLPCGSTIGPMSAASSGIRTVDVGAPMLSMHSCREMCGSADVEPMIALFRSFLDQD